MLPQPFNIAAATAPFCRKLSKAEVNDRPLDCWDGEIAVIRSAAEAGKALAELSEMPVLGFDTETRPAFRKGQFYLPSVVQFATDRKAWIFQLDLMDEDRALNRFLERAAPLKAGVSIVDDIADLRKRSDFRPGGFIDLGQVAEQAGMQTRGLRNLSANLLQFRISKSAQTSNWASPELSEKQRRYAATDAWVGYLLFHRMRELGILTESFPS